MAPIQIRNRIIQPESESIKLRMRLAGWLDVEISIFMAGSSKLE